MNNVERKERVSACRETMRQYLEAYLTSDEKRKNHSGQLKDFQGLLVRSVGLSTTVRVKAGGIRKFFEDNYLRDKWEVLDYFDKEKNIEAYAKSVYCVEGELFEDMEGSSDYPWFFLLQKARQVMESAFIDYLGKTNLSVAPGDDQNDDKKTGQKTDQKADQKTSDLETWYRKKYPEKCQDLDKLKEEYNKRKSEKTETDSGKENEPDPETVMTAALSHEKDIKYVHFLYTVAIYEIFIRQYMETIRQMHMQIKEMQQSVNAEKDEELNRRYEKVMQESDTHAIKKCASELADYMDDYLKCLRYQTAQVEFTNYLALNMNSLFAMIRVIVLIEQVNFNGGHEEPRDPADNKACFNAQLWKNRINKWGEGKASKEDKKGIEVELFSLCPEWKYNLSKYYKKMNAMISDNNLFEEFSKEGCPKFPIKFYKQEKLLREYIAILKKHTLWNRSEKEEQSLLEKEFLLAYPIWQVMEEIKGIV